MNKFFKYISLSLLVLVGISCGDQLRYDERETSFNVNYFTYSRYQLTTAIKDVAQKYGSAIKESRKGQCNLYFMDCYSGDQVSSFYTKTDQNWDFEGSNPYTSQFRTFNAINKLATTEGNLANVAASDILRCVVGAYMTEKYGDVPFSDASEGREGNLFPKFDTQKEIYEQMFVLLDKAVATLSDANSKGLPVDHDILFKGDKALWIKFANSLKFRLMVHSYAAFKKAGVDLAPKMQEIAAGGKFMQTNADNASIVFPGAQSDGGDGWYLQTKYGTGNEFFEQKPTKYLIDQLVAVDDPRLYVLFAPALTPMSANTESSKETIKINGYSYAITHDPAKNYSTSDQLATGRSLNGDIINVPYVLDALWFGTPNPLSVELQYKGSGLPESHGFYDNRRISGLSTLIAQLTDDRLRAVLMESSEMMFLLAEARKQGWISTGTVKEYYETGIRRSFERWKILDGIKPSTNIGSTQITDNFNEYFAKVTLDGSANDLDKIYLQKWLSCLLTNPTEAYTEIRRTGKPSFVVKIAPSFSTYSYPYRYIYPLDESGNNKANYAEAVTRLGGKDLASVKMWIFQ